MSGFYTTEDIARWDVSCKNSISVHLEKLATELPAQKRDFHLGMLSLSYYTRGMICVAKGDIPPAIESLREGVETLCRLFEFRPVNAGHFQSLLIALATRDDALVSKLARYYQPTMERRTPSS